MGAAWCKIHDVTGKIKVCPHIHSYVRVKTGRESQFTFSSLEEINAVTILFSRFLIIPENPLAYCSKCADDQHLPVGNLFLLAKLFFNYKGLSYLSKNTISECVICFYKQIFQLDYEDSEQLININNTTQIFITVNNVDCKK